MLGGDYFQVGKSNSQKVILQFGCLEEEAEADFAIWILVGISIWRDGTYAGSCRERN